MAKDTIESFLAASTEERLVMAEKDEYAGALAGYLGQAAYNEYRGIARARDRAHLGVEAAKNLVFVPGVMGSMLHSKTMGGVWWVDVRMRHHIDDLKLSSDGSQDADPTHQIVPFTTDPTYEPFLAAILAQDDFGHEVFPYDWRKPLYLSASALKDLVLKLHTENGGRPVHLVVHSMGGLMVRAALLKHGGDLWPKVGRIVFIGTPHYGSPAIAGYLKNHLWGFELMAVLGLYLSRETFRSLWGVLTLLPAPRGVYPGTRPNEPTAWRSEEVRDQYVHPCTNFDMYRAENWRLDLTSSQASQLQAILDATAAFHRDLYAAHEALDQSLRDRMVVIAGVGYRTLFRLAYEPRFFGLWEHTEKVTSRIRGEPHREGDGRVPLASAALENVHLRYVRWVHGGLPNIPAVYEDVFRWLREETMNLPNNVFDALSSHLSPDEVKSEAPNLDGTARVRPFEDDPGLWDMEMPDPSHLADMRARLEAGELPEFTRVRLL